MVAAIADGAPAHRVAVLYGSAQPYARLLHEHLGAADLLVNGPATRAVHERAIARGFLGMLELASTDSLAVRLSPRSRRRPPATSTVTP